MIEPESLDTPATHKAVYWLIGIGLVLVVIAAFIAWSVFSLREDQHAEYLRKQEQQKIAEQLQTLNANGDRFLREHDVLALLESFQDLSERVAIETANETTSERKLYQSLQEFYRVRINLQSFFSDEDLKFMENRRNQYTKRYGTALKAGIVKANQAMSDRRNELQKLKDALDVLSASTNH